MDHPAVISRFISDWKRRQGMAFREVLVTQVREVLRAWLGGAGKRPAARRAGVDVKTAARYIRAAQAAGLARDGDESQLTDELLGQVVAAVRPARPAGHGASWEALVPVTAEVTGWVKDGVTLVKIGELLERRGMVVPYRTLARFAAAECGYSSSRQQVTVPVADGEPGEEVQIDFGYLGMIPDGDRRRKLHALVFTAVLSRYCFVYLTFSQTTAEVIAGCEAAWSFFGGMFKVLIPEYVPRNILRVLCPIALCGRWRSASRDPGDERLMVAAVGHITLQPEREWLPQPPRREEVTHAGEVLRKASDGRSDPGVVDRPADRAVRGLAGRAGLRHPERAAARPVAGCLRGVRPPERRPVAGGPAGPRGCLRGQAGR